MRLVCLILACLSAWGCAPPPRKAIARPRLAARPKPVVEEPWAREARAGAARAWKQEQNRLAAVAWAQEIEAVRLVALPARRSELMAMIVPLLAVRGGSAGGGGGGPNPSPDAPTNVTAANTGSGQATIYWDYDDGVYSGSTFEIQRSGDGVTYFALGTAPAGAVSYVNSGISFSAPYYWRVRAIGLTPSAWAATPTSLFVP